MHHQRYLDKSNKFFQDNQSAIRMDMNEWKSCTGNSHNIDTRYFFIKYRVEKEEISILYCTKNLTLSDYFTNPLHGALLNKFRDIIMRRHTSKRKKFIYKQGACKKTYTTERDSLGVWRATEINK